MPSDTSVGSVEVIRLSRHLAFSGQGILIALVAELVHRHGDNFSYTIREVLSLLDANLELIHDRTDSSNCTFSLRTPAPTPKGK